MKKFLVLAVLLAFVLPSFAITDVPASVPEEEQMTLGNVQRFVKVGSTQEEVVSALGSPNIVTKDADGKDTWVYDKVSTITSYTNSGFGVNLGGLVGGIGGTTLGGGAGGIGYNKKQGKVQTNQKTLTVVIKFDKQYKVESFRYHMSNF